MEWVIVSDGETRAAIVRSGYKTAREAAAARREMELRMADDDTTNLLLLTRPDAEAFIREVNKR